MADIVPVFDGLVSHLAASGFYEQVPRHEPKNAPGPGLTAANWLQSGRPAVRASGLAATSMRIEFVTRIYTGMLAEDADEIDPAVYAAVDAHLTAMSADFTVGGLVMEVDLLGAYGEPFQWRAGYLRQGPALYRTVDIVTPVILADAYPQAA